MLGRWIIIGIWILPFLALAQDGEMDGDIEWLKHHLLLGPEVTFTDNTLITIPNLHLDMAKASAKSIDFESSDWSPIRSGLATANVLNDAQINRIIHFLKQVLHVKKGGLHILGALFALPSRHLPGGDAFIH